MKSQTHVLSALVVLILALFTIPLKAHADTYAGYDLGTGNRTTVFGITDSGTVVLEYSLPVGAPLCAISHICTEYETYTNGVMVHESPTAPGLVYDDGSACVPTASFAVDAIGSGVCNNGHEIYEATPTGGHPETFFGPDIADAFAFFPISVDEVNLNSAGDFAYDISHPGEDFGLIAEGIDLSTTPEPGSIILLGTGCLTAATFRRRLFPRSRAANSQRT